MVQNAVATTQLISLSRECRTLTQLKQVHAYLLKSLLPQNPSAIAPRLSVAATSSDRSFFSYARLIFNHLPFRNSFMYNTMIRGYLQANSPIPAILLYLDLLGYGFEVNKYTFSPVIKACTVLALWSMLAPARLLFDKSPERAVVMWTAMIDGHGKIRDIENARFLFEEMPQRNMIRGGTKPKESVLVTVLTAYAHLAALSQTLWIHSYVNRYNLESNTILATALVDMYCQCGYVESAISVFVGIRKRDIGAWNAMISGVALCGDVKKSIELFDQMAISGTRPTETTFVALLSASRAGMVQEAEKFIEEKMGGLGGGDANVWGDLLGACRIYEMWM
ncbi:hypothetical protein SLEP1_g18253 [Rubroshorea leprosula]|uniref:Pentatricopeptide repeat-containing protein n=1 Tax=Rubroshorea leprosula TaxID=152421 RepID=A0AAV5J8M8_9ROSI|nr:hypothetical protein SLEP1_g18253 [Rubroshorea leprosula]